MRLWKNLAQLLSRPVADSATTDLYRACVAQARRVEFYQTLGIPDTIDGRFDLLVLHVFLVMRRLAEQRDVKQKLFDLMFTDMDRCLREMGVGDMSIGKKIKPMIQAFYGRITFYERALNEPDERLAESLQRNLYGASPATPENVQRMADYVRQALAALDRQDLSDIITGHVVFVTPV